MHLSNLTENPHYHYDRDHEGSFQNISKKEERKNLQTKERCSKKISKKIVS